MAKKSNTLLIVGLIAVGGYFLLNRSAASAPSQSTSNDAINSARDFLISWGSGAGPEVVDAIKRFTDNEVQAMSVIVSQYFNTSTPLPGQLQSVYDQVATKYHILGY